MSLNARRLCFVGPMVGRNEGYVTTQGERLSDLFARTGYPVTTVSTLRNRYARAADIAVTLLSRRLDVVILQVFSGPSFMISDLASRIASSRGLPVVMILRGGNLPEFMTKHPRWARAVLARADALVAPSTYLARAAGQAGYRCETIPNVIELDAYSYRHREQVGPRLFWMRAFHPIYNPALAVRVLARVRREIPHATLVMAGPDKGDERRTKQLAAELGVADAIRFAGFLDMPAKVREMSLADIYLNTNRVDNTPVSVIEAAAMGLPVVATRVGGIPDLLVDAETALLVDDDDELGMTAAVLRLIRERELAARLSRQGRTFAESCSAELLLPRWTRLVDSLEAGA